MGWQSITSHCKHLVAQSNFCKWVCLGAWYLYIRPASHKPANGSVMVYSQRAISLGFLHCKITFFSLSPSVCQAKSMWKIEHYAKKKNHCCALSSSFLILVSEIDSHMPVLHAGCCTGRHWWFRYHPVMSWTYLTQPTISSCLLQQSQPVLLPQVVQIGRKGF